MAKYAHADVLDNGIKYVKDNATKMLLISAYTAGQSYATVVGNKLAEVTMTSADYTLSGADAAARVLTVAAGKSGAAAATAGGTPDLHIAFTNGADKVLWVTDETSNQPITSGNTVNFPSVTLTSGQPT